MRSRRSENRNQLNLFDGAQQTSIQKEIVVLDREMASAVEQGEYERAKVLAEKQEKLLGALMKG
ncbi:hypothetical protein E3J38_03500 [candidate division TA06 bacterium]|uniref:Uncharacterized protein n=1 Tax=candidate division TA06 bacterium TaxID=2250710 RepID=A0A523XQS3_UNCT6|nr:MAG: hypothetical protein E3J62_08035 [candidate division TA06 bacterium]TET81646.1 MAG: hypothetical protein E3J38_03500 [candidate division TA06 bacterium]